MDTVGQAVRGKAVGGLGTEKEREIVYGTTPYNSSMASGGHRAGETLLTGVMKAWVGSLKILEDCKSGVVRAVAFGRAERPGVTNVNSHSQPQER